MDPFMIYRRNSRGPCLDPPARVHPKIMFGPGFYLNNEFIEKYNITHILNCATDSVVPETVRENLGDKYFCINAEDSFNVDITSWFPIFEYKMDKFLRDSESKVVYVNCQMGINRSGFLTAMYASLKFGYEYEAVTRAILLQRPCALLNYVFNKQVHEYIKKHR
jgi:protein-tyrosine phosphatase